MGSRSSRFGSRLRTLARALLKAPWRAAYRPESPKVIGIFHHLLLGDTLMLAGLFKTLRQRWPAARIVCLCSPAFLPLFEKRPWGVEPLPYDPRRPETLAAVFSGFSEGLDLALLPGDNRYALLARACGARWIRGLAGDAPAWKNGLCDELIDWPQAATALPEIFASLAGDFAIGISSRSQPIEHYTPGEWPAPSHSADFSPPAGTYAVLHLGASNPLRYWPATHWQALAEALVEAGVQPVWSCGPNEKHLLDIVDRENRYPRSWAGTLGLADLWHLLAGARLLICPDSGVAHLAKLVGVPTVCIFGQGSDVLFGAGAFFDVMPFRPIIRGDIACRDQNLIFGRRIEWVRRCARTPAACHDARCMRDVLPTDVLDVCRMLLAEKRGV